MKLHYYPETDSLYIDLQDRPAADSQEVALSRVDSAELPVPRSA